ncbi:MAG: hypothetical protein QF609_10455 [Gammaproteobacteria bacterium]|nr:hypothetical protein [Gammaproteobacteria bacterium]
MAALTTALAGRDAALATLEQTESDLQECLTQIAPEPDTAFQGLAALLTLVAVAHWRRKLVDASAAHGRTA